MPGKSIETVMEGFIKVFKEISLIIYYILCIF